MSLTIAPNLTPMPTGARTDHSLAHPVAAEPPDRVERSAVDRSAALLTVGALAAVQVIPGVAEGEALAGAAALAGSIARTALAVGKVSLPATPLVPYAKTLLHDAARQHPAARAVDQAIEQIGHAADERIRAALHVPHAPRSEE